MSFIFEPFDKLTKSIGKLFSTSRHGTVERYYAQNEKVEIDVWPGGSHWQVTYTQRTAKPASIPNEDVHTNLRHIVEEQIVRKKLLTWEEMLKLLQSSPQMSFSTCLARLTNVTLIVMVVVVKHEGLYAVMRQTYDPNIHGTGFTLLTREKDLMNFYYLAGIDQQDVPKPSLVDVNHAPEMPQYPHKTTPDLLFKLGETTNKLPDNQEDRFWGGKR